MINVTFEVNKIERSVYLPCVPRIGEQIYLGNCVVMIINVTYTANTNKVYLEVN